MADPAADATPTESTDPNSWMAAGAAAQGGGGGTPSPTSSPTVPMRTSEPTPTPSVPMRTPESQQGFLKAAQAAGERGQTAAMTNPAGTMAPGDPSRSGLWSSQEKAVPFMLRPARGGVVGAMDKVLDAMTGTTRPEIWKDDAGNEFVYHPNLTRGQQWIRMAAMLGQGAAAGFTAGRGAGGGGRAALAGFQVGEQAQQKAKDEETEMSQKVRQDTIDRFNWQKAQQDLIESTLKANREKITTDRETKKFYDDEVARLTSPTFGGKIYGSPVSSVAELGTQMHQDPSLISGFIKEGIIKPVTTLDENMQPQITFIKMPARYGEQMLPPGQEIDHFNSSTGQLEKQKTTDPMTKRELDVYNSAAHTDSMDYQTKQQHLRGETATAGKTEEELTELKAMAPQKLEELKTKILQQKADTALAWANERKSKIETKNLEATTAGDDVESNAQALVDQRSAPSLMSKRKDYNTIMRRADELSQAQTGKPYDREAGEIGYKSRMKLIDDYTGTGGEAKNLESYDKFLGHALSASESINAMRNTNAKLVNMPWNKLSNLVGTQRSNEVVAAQVAIGTLRTEYETMLKNNTALTVEDRKEGEAILSENANAWQIQAAMNKMVHTGVVRMRSSDYTYSRTMHEHVPMLLSPDGQRSLQHFGVDPLDVYSDNVGIAVQAPDGTIKKVNKEDAKLFLSHGGKLVEP